MFRSNQKMLMVVGIAAVMATTFFYTLSFGNSKAEGFFQQRAAVYATLSKQMESVPPGVKTRLPPSLETLRKTPRPIEESHIRHVIQRTDWNSVGNFSLLLDLDETVLVRGEQGSSETMAAAKLLQHYFGCLASHGLVSRSRSLVVGSLQSASAVWVSADDSLLIEGTIFVSPKEKQAIVTGLIREQLSRR